MTGRITSLLVGFGFIHTDDGGHWFFHKTDVQGEVRFYELEVEDLVEFEEVLPTPVKGRRATNVRVTNVEGGHS